MGKHFGIAIDEKVIKQTDRFLKKQSTYRNRSHLIECLLIEKIRNEGVTK